MEHFKEIYDDLYKLQRFCGFWPVPESDHMAINMAKRILINLIIIVCIAIQYSTLRNVELNLNTVISTVSFSGPMILFTVRYLSFLRAIKTMAKTFQEMESDYVKWKNKIEMELLQEEIKQAKMIYVYYFRLVTFAVVGLYLAFIPIILQQKHQVEYLRFFGFYFIEQSIGTTLICFHIMFVYGIGIFCILGTEASLSVVCHHVCGLLRITGYQITKAVNDTARSPIPMKVDIVSVVEAHRQAIVMVESVSKDLGMSYLVSIGTAIVSFAMNLWRLYSVIDHGTFEEAVAPVLIIISHIIMLFLGNYCSQRVTNSNLEIHDIAYFTEWYGIPLHERKLIIFIMMKMVRGLAISVPSLFTGGFEGYSTIMRTAFSYFTVLISM